MPYLLLGIAILILFLLFGRWFVSANPHTLARTIKIGGILLGVGAVLTLIATGRFGLVFLMIPFLLPFLSRRLATLWQGAMGVGMGTTGFDARGRSNRQTEVRTAYLAMRLDLETGNMSGEVVAGPYVGRNLDTMGENDLIGLLEACRSDPDSVQVLEAWLDRRHPDWRAAQARRASDGGGGARGGGAMTREEAFAVLELQPGATPEEIKVAHRRLMAKFHPDRGGSTYLAAKINQAKDLLLDS